jgi:integrase
VSNRIPKYRRRSDGLAFVEHVSIPNASHRLCLGEHGTPESQQRYRDFLEQLAGARGRVVVAGRWKTIREIRDAYLDYAEQHYMRSYGLSSEFVGMTYALAALDSFLNMPSSQFGPSCLAAIRTQLAADGYARSTVNHTLSRIKKVFRWACETELCPTDLYHRLISVRGLVEGEGGCAEPDPVQPATIASINGLLPYVSPTIGAMIVTQYKAGMRPDETCRLRADLIDMRGNVWLYTPERHKTAHRGLTLTKAIPPSVQEVIRPFLGNAPYIFQPGRKRERYFTETYRRAVLYGFKRAAKAGVVLQEFTPNQLRHAIATHVAQKFGNRAAQVWCGHELPSTTARYIAKQQTELLQISQQLEADWASSA